MIECQEGGEKLSRPGMKNEMKSSKTSGSRGQIGLIGVEWSETSVRAREKCCIVIGSASQPCLNFIVR